MFKRRQQIAKLLEENRKLREELEDMQFREIEMRPGRRDNSIYEARDRPKNPKGAFVVKGCPERRAYLGDGKGSPSENATPVTEGEPSYCPFIEIGGIFTNKTSQRIRIEELVYGNGHYAMCQAFSRLSLIRGSDFEYYSPAIDVQEVDCKKCPILLEHSHLQT